MENTSAKIELALIGNRTFGGKHFEDPTGPTYLVDACEFTNVMDNQMRVVIIGLLIGDLRLPKEYIRVEVTKDSAYYTPYFKTAAKLHSA